MTEQTLSLHCHSTYSQRDSILNIEKAVERVAAAGCSHFALSDHGTIQGWLALRDACKKNKVVPVYGVELYVNDLIPGFIKVLAARDEASAKDRPAAVISSIRDHVFPLAAADQAAWLTSNLDAPSDIAAVAKQLTYRIGHGYQHLVATAINKVGRENLVKLTNLGWMGGFYIKPQVTTEQCIALSEGVVFTTACMGGPIARRMAWDPTGAAAERYLQRWAFARERFFLEVQPLDLLSQRRYNQHLVDLSGRTGFPLILSQDCHHLQEDEWRAHRVLMLSQNDQPIDALEERYSVDGREVAFSDLKQRFGAKTTWEAQEAIEREGYQVCRRAGHHYGDVKLHWRTNDEVRKQCESTNPELLPVLERALASCSQVLDQVRDEPWSSSYRLQRHDGARERILDLCQERMVKLGIIPRSMSGGIDVGEGDGDHSSERGWRYRSWLDREDKVITACGFWDYIWTLYVWTKRVQEEGIPIGYARGSGGGCLVMYLLGIIRVDPVEHGLFFERFLNPARLGLDPNTLEKVKEVSSCPDVDLDFSSIHRGRVVQIAEELFGKDHVMPVGTIGEAKIKTALADLCRVLGVTQAEYMPASKELPDDPTNKMTVEQAFEVPAFGTFCDRYPAIRKILPSLVGVMRSNGTHAGGVCIADVPIASAIPVVRSGTKEGAGLVTGFGESGAERALESVGFIKFDALATDTVDHVSLCARALHKEHLAKGGQPWVSDGELMLYPEQIPEFKLNDADVMRAIFHTGNTDGIFQMEEAIGKDMCKLVKPDNIGELSDISTMIRPGCLQAAAAYINERGNEVATTGLQFEYAARKFNPAQNPAPHGIPESILEVLRPTQYCCIYQEQMMFLIQVLTGGKMSLGEGDLYRRACEHAGKGKPEFVKKLAEMEEEMRRVSSFDPALVDRVCAIIKGGANYSFNKSHSISYSLFSYAQAWFKHRYPHIFYASHVTLLAAKNKLTKAHKIINNARSLGIVIKSPHVLHSTEEATWSPDGKTVYLPLTVVKGLKDETAKAIARIGAGRPDLTGFLIAAIADPAVKKNHVASLAKVGGFDGMEVDGREMPRLQAMAASAYTLARATTKTKPEVIASYCREATAFQPVSEISSRRASLAEVEVFGSFINECPLDAWVPFFDKNGWTPLSQIEPALDEVFRVYFLITDVVKKVHKSGKNQGKEWYKLTCWDGHEVCELSVWAYDLDGSEGVMGYRSLIAPHGVYCAEIRADGERPATLSHRSAKHPGDVLFRKA